MDHDHQDANTGPRTPSAVATSRPAPAPTPPKSLPPFRVLLHNDDVNLDVYVVETIVQLTPLGVARAKAAMAEAHHRGVSLLLVTHKERAELYADQFTSKRLTVTIEPAE